MVFAIFTHTIKFERHDLDSVREAFDRDEFRLSRWGFAGTLADKSNPEYDYEDISTIVRLSVENDRITPFATDEEIFTMFYDLMMKVMPETQLWESNNNNHQLISIVFKAIPYYKTPVKISASVKKELNKFNAFADSIIERYTANPIENDGQIFWQQRGIMKKMQNFAKEGGQEIIDYANVIYSSYKGSDAEELKKQLAEQIKNVIRTGSRTVVGK